MLLGRLGANLLANMLVKEVVRDGGRGGGGVIWTGERTNRAGQDF